MATEDVLNAPVPLKACGFAARLCSVIGKRRALLSSTQAYVATLCLVLWRAGPFSDAWYPQFLYSSQMSLSLPAVVRELDVVDGAPLETLAHPVTLGF